MLFWCDEHGKSGAALSLEELKVAASLLLHPKNAASQAAPLWNAYGDQLAEILAGGGTLHVSLDGGTIEELRAALGVIVGPRGVRYKDEQIKTS